MMVVTEAMPPRIGSNGIIISSFVEVLLCCPGVPRTLSLKQNACQKGENDILG
jgi:hypothetical protein